MQMKLELSADRPRLYAQQQNMATDTDGDERSSSDSGRPPDAEIPFKVAECSRNMSRPTDSISDRRQEPGDAAKGRRRKASGASIVDGLLFEIYDRWQRDAAADSDTFTEYSSTSDAFLGRFDSVQLDFEQSGLNRTYLETKDVEELRKLKSDMQHRVTQISARLIRQLKSRDRLLARIKRHCDVITAILQASSPKRRVDSKICFSIEPLAGDSDAFAQWRDAMRAVAKLPMGIPSEFRRKVWLSLADNHIANMRIDWEKTKRFAFNERSNPDDNKLGLQIVKDLHRTGCRGFTGEDSEQDRACLKRVLLAYARWNKHVGYCQGFNIIAALILEVVDRREEDALKVMIYLIDHVLPESYFANNLRALSVDMAVFRELLHIQLPQLSRHLDHLQVAARDHNTGANYEPPLTNVFTMQWFLTLFATCLPKSTALRLWDCVLLENSDVLLRTALAIWAKLKSRIMRVDSADEFYTAMGSIAQDMLDNSIIGADELVRTMYSMAPDAFLHLSDLREKYTYNITPFSAAMATGKRPNKSALSMFSDDDDDDDTIDNITCFTGIFPTQFTASHNRNIVDANRTVTGSRNDISKAGLGVYEVTPPLPATPEGSTSAYAERMTLDLHTLHLQYNRLRERQKQAHIILAAASAKHAASVRAESKVVAPIKYPIVVNHLFVRRKPGTGGRNRTITGAPQIAPMYACSGIVNAQLGVKTRAIARAKSLLEAQRRNPGQNVMTRGDAPAQNVMRTHKRKDSTDSEVSNTSSVCGRSSTSSGSTVCAADSESERSLSIARSESDISAEGQDVKDLIWLCDGVDGDAAVCDSVVESHKSGTENVRDEEHDISDDSDVSDGVTNIGVRRVSCEGAESEAVVEFDETKDVDKLSQDTCDTDEQVFGDKRSCVDRESHGHATEQSHDINRGSHLTHNIVKQAQNNKTCTSQPKQDDDLQYGTTNADCHPTLLQLSRGWTPPPSDGTADTPEGAHLSTLNRSTVGGATSPMTERVFNPFPSVHVSQRRTRNAVRLGLYSTETTPTRETGITVGSGVKQIGRAQINACLHHHYMADMRQKARKAKR